MTMKVVSSSMLQAASELSAASGGFKTRFSPAQLQRAVEQRRANREAISARRAKKERQR